MPTARLRPLSPRRHGHRETKFLCDLQTSNMLSGWPSLVCVKRNPPQGDWPASIRHPSPGLLRCLQPVRQTTPRYALPANTTTAGLRSTASLIQRLRWIHVQHDAGRRGATAARAAPQCVASAKGGLSGRRPRRYHDSCISGHPSSSIQPPRTTRLLACYRQGRRRLGRYPTLERDRAAPQGATPTM